MLGPIFVDIAGPTLSLTEEKYLRHPVVGGVVLFSRNYQSPAQLKELCAHIHSLRSPALIISVDHEGGVVQRFKTGFTALPAMNVLGELFIEDAEQALQQAETLGYTMASELKACGVDLSFAPVLDVEKGISHVLKGGRAISGNIEDLVAIGKAYITGMHEAGMVATGKHFPGHGSVEADSHLALPVDERSFEKIVADDIQPFIRLLPELQAIMPAHIVYAEVDALPASLSAHWLQHVLRQQLGFQGLVVSDCLSMQGAVKIAPDLSQRVHMALNAGCDIVLVCNIQSELIKMLSDYSYTPMQSISQKIESLRAYGGEQ